MKIKVEHSPVFRFKASNAEGNTMQMDASPSIGGEQTGMRPMEVLLAGLGGCSGIDVVSILTKMKQPFQNLTIEVNGHRNADEVPSLFTEIDVDFYVEGEHLDQNKIQHAVDLSMQKYCSVAKTLEKSAKINYAIYINNKKIQLAHT